MENELLDILIVGAGLSGIGAAVHLGKTCPGRRVAIIEARDNIGGTWDLFRYPGIRSDSDMYTLGYNFKPWTDRKAIADAPTILNYLHETIAEYNLSDTIRFGRKLVGAQWSSEEACWNVDVEDVAQGTVDQVRCRFLFMCSGYYSYKGGYSPEFQGAEDFAGQIIHPQKWPEDLDYAGKRIVVIGSGATAVTLVPAMADTAAHVTMLQRSPTYIASVPGEDRLALALRKYLPGKMAYFLTRWRNVLRQMLIYNFARKRPRGFRKLLLNMVRQEMGDDVDMSHFSPDYNPWDQRLCAVPDADLFQALKKGTASIVTDHIDRFTATGISLKSGAHLDADIIVTATGLKLVTAGEAEFHVDGQPVNFADCVNYKGVMFSNVPNFGLTSGYTNASWTLKADLTAEYIGRLLNKMDQKKADFAVPYLVDDHGLAVEPIVDFSSGYIQRAIQDLPKQGPKKPWRLNQNYALDIINLRYRAVDDGVMRFGVKRPAKIAPDGADKAAGAVAEAA